jgi:putative lipoprotein
MTLCGCATAASLLLTASMVFGQGEALTINGTATYRERMALPPDAVFEATLEDVSRADSTANVLGRARIESPGNPPFHFSINYDPGQIVTNHTYVVRARVTEGGKLLFTSDQRYQVLTLGHGSEIAMMMLRRVSTPPAAAPATGSDAPLRETYWKLVQLGEKPVTASDQQREANLIFHTDQNRVTGSGGCNRLTGSYTLEGHTLRFGGVASTRMACMQGMETETAFLAALQEVSTWRTTGQQLDLYDAGGKLLARFTAVALK